MARLEGKQRVEILTVDPSQRLVEGQLRDGVPISIAVWETSAAFRWPRVGEMWSVNYVGGYPMLGDRIQDRTEDFLIEDINQGDMFLDSEIIYDAKAQRMVAVNGNLTDGGFAVYQESLDAFNLTLPIAPTANVLSATQVKDIGEVGQIRAGRVLSLQDFTNLGLSAPVGIYNLSDNTDVSGNGRNLLSRNSPFTLGITGTANEASQFNGDPSLGTGALKFIDDVGVSDPFRIRTGSWGCWFRTAKRGTQQMIISKSGATFGYYIYINGVNALQGQISTDGTNTPVASGITDVADDRWHFGVVTYDGTKLRLYLDANLEMTTDIMGTINGSAGSFNIGGYGGNQLTVTTSPFFGRVDEAFVTTDILNLDQIRNLYCASVPHLLGAVPTDARMTIRRHRRGSPLPVSSFPAQPVRLYNTANSLIDEGSNALNLTISGGSVVSVGGPNGASNDAYHFNGSGSLQANDTGLPSGTQSRSYGLWIKSTSATAAGVLCWGTLSTADSRIIVSTVVSSFNGADSITGPGIVDSLWHFVVATEDNLAIDSLKRKLYVDGRLVGSSTVLNSITLAGANAFRLGANQNGTAPFSGQLSRGFVYQGVLTPEQIHTLYNTGSPQNKNLKAVNDNVEDLGLSRLLVTFDDIEGSDKIDLQVIR